MMSFSAIVSRAVMSVSSMVPSSFSVTVISFADFFRKCSMEELMKTRLIHPSKDPSARNRWIFLYTLINPSCNKSCASSELFAYLRQTAYIFGANRLYSSSCITRSPAMHPAIKSDSEIVWLLFLYKLFLDLGLGGQSM